jgi:restriction system protein
MAAGDRLMSVLTAAEMVLAEAGEPLHYREITQRMLTRGLWTTLGKTPEATVNARLGTEIQRHPGTARFQRKAPGMFALRSWGLAEFVPGQPADGSGDPVDAETSPGAPRHLSFSDAAERVLEEFAAGKPMHYRAIMAKVLELGLVRTQGQTPEATLHAQLMAEVDRKARRGDPPRFARHGKGYWGLARWMASGLAFEIEQHNAEVRRRLLARLMTLPPAEFETLVSRLLVALGFEEVSVTGRSGDGGIDVRGTLVVGAVIRTRMAVQAKRWKANVQSPVVQQVRGSLGTHDQGLIITTSDFSTGARTEAERPNAVPVALMNGEQLVALLVEHSIGVRRAPYDLLQLGDGDEE